ncbi:MAG: hemolysin family protein [Candidatus Omnitrophota bacterium]
MDSVLTLPNILLLLILALVSFLFSASETSVIKLSKIKLRHMVAKGVKRAKYVQRLVANLDKFIVGILVGNNFVNIAISAIVTAIFVSFLGFRWGIIAATLVTSLFILIFCEIAPKILAIKLTEKMALWTAPFMGVFLKVFHPIIIIFTGISNLILRIFNITSPKRSPLITEEELKLMIEIGREEGVVSDEERKMLYRIFKFGDTQLKEVMIPKDKIVAVNLKVTAEELLNIFVEEGHARLPVYEESMDRIIGIIYASDLLYLIRDKGLFLIQDHIHEPRYVRTTMRVNELLLDFQKDKIQIAIVVDEHKNTLGLVTLEDLLEEIVGEIEERHVNHAPKNKS